jgi:hypothetical protein
MAAIIRGIFGAAANRAGQPLLKVAVSGRREGHQVISVWVKATNEGGAAITIDTLSSWVRAKRGRDGIAPVAFSSGPEPPSVWKVTPQQSGLRRSMSDAIGGWRVRASIALRSSPAPGRAPTAEVRSSIASQSATPPAAGADYRDVAEETEASCHINPIISLHLSSRSSKPTDDMILETSNDAYQDSP